MADLHRLTFLNARRAIKLSRCSLGKVHRPRRLGRHHRLRVTRQIPMPGPAYPEGHRIGIWMR